MVIIGEYASKCMIFAFTIYDYQLETTDCIRVIYARSYQSELSY